MKKLKGVVNKEQRKRLAEGAILSVLHQHLIRRSVDLEALQREQNEAMMWVGGEGRKAFRVEKAKEQKRLAPREASSSQGHNTECYKGALRGKTRRLNGEDRNERKLREAKIQEDACVDEKVMEHKGKEMVEDDAGRPKGEKPLEGIQKKRCKHR